jgi:hypothetical protein
LLGAVAGFKKLVDLGQEYNKTMENSTIGIASLLAAQGKFTDAAGRELEGNEKVNASMQMSSDIMKELQKDNLRTVATLDQLVTAFQGALAPGLQMQLDPNTQIRPFTVAMMQAAAAMQVPLDMMNEEMRGMLTGQIQPRNTIIATRLGITPEMIRRYQGDANGLFAFLMSKLNEFTLFGDKIANTYTGLFSNMKDAMSRALGIATEPFFKELKEAFRELYNYVVQIDEKTGDIKLNPEFQKNLDVVNSLLKTGLALIRDDLHLINYWLGQATKAQDWLRNKKDQLNILYSEMGRPLPDLTKDLQPKDVSASFKEQQKAALEYNNELSKLDNIQVNVSGSAEAMAHAIDKSFKFSPKEKIIEMQEFVKSWQEKMDELGQTTSKTFQTAVLNLKKGATGEVGKKLIDIDAEYNVKQIKLVSAARKYANENRYDQQKVINSAEMQSLQANIEINREKAKQAAALDSIVIIEKQLNALVEIRRDAEKASLDRQYESASGFKDYMGSQIEGLISAQEAVTQGIVDIRSTFDSASDWPALTALKDQWYAINSLGNEAVITFEKMDAIMQDISKRKLDLQVQQIERILNQKNLTAEGLNQAQQGIFDLQGGADSSALKIAQLEFERKATVAMGGRGMNFRQWQDWQATLNAIDNEILAETNHLTELQRRVNELNAVFREKQQFIEDNEMQNLQWVNETVSEIIQKLSAGTSFRINVDAALNELQKVRTEMDSLRNSQGQSYNVEFTGEASPVRPLSETINNVIDMLKGIGSGSEYKIDFLAQQGISTGSIGEIMKAMNSYQNAAGQYNTANQMTNTGWWMMNSNYDAVASQDWAEYYKGVASQLKSSTDLQYMNLVSAILSGMNDSSSSSGGGSGINIDVGPITISVAGSGDARDDVITIADRIDEEIASKIKSNRSLIPAALGI